MNRLVYHIRLFIWAAILCLLLIGILRSIGFI
jgi:hypothetical protein